MGTHHAFVFARGGNGKTDLNRNGGDLRETNDSGGEPPIPAFLGKGQNDSREHALSAFVTSGATTKIYSITQKTGTSPSVRSFYNLQMIIDVSWGFHKGRDGLRSILNNLRDGLSRKIGIYLPSIDKTSRVSCTLFHCNVLIVVLDILM